MEQNTKSKRDFNVRSVHPLKYVSLAIIFMFGILGMTSTRNNGGSNGDRQWVDSYNLSFITSQYSTIALRYFQNNQWQGATYISTTGNIYGVGLGRDLNGPMSLLGVSKDGDIYFRMGLGLVFDQNPAYELQDSAAKSAPSIAYIGDSLWAVAYNYNGASANVRPLFTKHGHAHDGFAAPVILDQYTFGRPGLAYHNGKLVCAWIQKSPEHKFRTLAATLQPLTHTFNLVNKQYGEVPSGPSSYIPENAADPALTHNGAGLFYLAVIKRSGYSGSTHDAVFVYSSPDGLNWTRINDSLPDNSSFHTGQTNLSLAAWPNGELLLAITTTDGSGQEVGKVFRFRNGSWTQLDWWPIFSSRPRQMASLSLIRSRYLK